MATKLLNQEPALNNIRQYGIFDDFIQFADHTSESSASPWSMVGDTCTATILTAATTVPLATGGVLDINTVGTDNAELYIHTEKIFKMASDAPLFAVIRACPSCITANQIDFMWGFSDAIAANLITDDAAPTTATRHLIAMFKGDNATALTCYSNGSDTAVANRNQTTTDTTVTDTEWREMAMMVEPVSSTDKRITYYYGKEDGTDNNYPTSNVGYWNQLKDTSGNLIQHTWSIADTALGTGELSLFFGCKAGAAEAQHLYVDFIGAWQLRKY